MIAKRLFDLLVTTSGLFILSPVFIVISIWVKLDSKGPVFYRQERVGQYGKLFKIHKFRTMMLEADKRGPDLTAAGDSRITRSGRLLRYYKLDELPQFIDVLQGHMSLVGPRPEIPKYVAMYPSEAKVLILSVKPGITDFASIEFMYEPQMLAQSGDPEKSYINEILPLKLIHCLRYVQERSLWLDVVIILRTLKAIVFSKYYVCASSQVVRVDETAPLMRAATALLGEESRNDQQGRHLPPSPLPNGEDAIDARHVSTCRLEKYPVENEPA